MDKFVSHPEWWTPAEVAARWRKSSDTILRWIRKGDLLAMPVGASYLIHQSVIDQREAKAIATTTVAELVAHVRDSRRNMRWMSSGIDHFARRKKT